MEPQLEALKLVPETVAAVYKVVPLTYQEGVLAVAVAEEAVFALDDLKNFTGVRELRHVIKPIDEIEEAWKAYA
jgi:type IV pilus assembly protein PilB